VVKERGREGGKDSGWRKGEKCKWSERERGIGITMSREMKERARGKGREGEGPFESHRVMERERQ